MERREELYLENIGRDFRQTFEKETGKEIGLGTYFDITEVIEFYGGKIAYSQDLEVKEGIKAKVSKVNDNPECNFKITIDKAYADSLKVPDKEGNITYTKWNMKILELFYYVISAINEKRFKDLDDDEMIYPRKNNKKRQKVKTLSNRKK